MKLAPAGVPRARHAQLAANRRALVVLPATAAARRQRNQSRPARDEPALRTAARRGDLIDALVEHATDGVVLIDAHGRIAYASPPTAALLGYTVPELIGRVIFDLIHPDDGVRVRQLFASILDHPGATARGEFRFRLADGSWGALEGSGTNRLETPGINAVVGVFRPAPASVPYGSPFEVLADQFRVLIENAVHITAIVDADGRIQYVSPVVQRMLGYSPSDLRGVSWFELIHPDDIVVARERFRALVQQPGSGQFAVFRTRHKDGSARVLEAIASNRLDDARIRGVVIDVRDVTERKWTADRLQDSLNALVAIHAVGRQVGSSVEQRAIAEALLDGAERVAPIDSALVLLNDGRGRPRIVHARNEHHVAPETRRSRPLRAARRRALRDGQPQTVRIRPAGARKVALDGLMLPLRAHDRPTGLLEAYGPGLAREVSNEALRILADQAAGAFEHARLFAELAKREQRLEEVVRRLQLSHEEERRRIAYDIHDGLAQVAFAAQQHLEAFAAGYHGRSLRQQAVLGEALALTSQTVADARRLIGGLRPMVLDQNGLAMAIVLELHQLRADGWDVTFEENLADERLPPAIETALFRVTQEALTNARAHAETRRVAVTLDRQARLIRVEVRDWGRGFRPAAVLRAAGPSERVGLAGMQDRISLLEGRCVIRSRPGAGTRIVAEVPIATRAPEPRA